MERGSAAPSRASRRTAASQHPRCRSLRFEPLESRDLFAASLGSLSIPQLSSRPNAPATLYLDFDGHVEPRWASYTNVTTPKYDSDGNKASFSAAEVAAIREIWARVSEDYAPFKVNVTTVAPPLIADRVAARVAIGGSYSDWYGRSAGGLSYVGGFSGNSSNVAYVFSSTLGSGNPRYIAEAVSHEAGHLFGLQHQATWNGGQLVAEYAAGTAAWAPIMGVSYYAGRTTWANGPTTDGPTAYEDNLSILASSANGFGYVADDYGNSIATATALPINSNIVSASGLIGRNDDRDVFKFSTSGGQVSFTLDVAQYGPNLDGVLELQNAAGKALVTANSANSFGGSLTTSLAAGTYYVVVHSSGGYGNLGRYTLGGSVAAAATAPGSAPPPSTSLPQDPPAGEGTPPVTSAGSQIVDDGTVRFVASGSWKKLTGSGYASDTQWASANSGASSTWTFANLAPGQYRVAATWSGSGLNAVDAPFSIIGGSRLLSTVRVNQQRSASTFRSDGAAWQNLGTFTVTGNSLSVRLNNSASGRVVADAVRLERVDSMSGGSAFLQAQLPTVTSVVTQPLPFSHRLPPPTPASSSATAAFFSSEWPLPLGTKPSVLETTPLEGRNASSEVLSPSAVDAALDEELFSLLSTRC